MRTVTMMLLGAGVMIATTLMLLGTPQEVGAARRCTLAHVRGTYGFQFTAFAPDPQDFTRATVPFAETGTFFADAQGNVTGASDASYGGQI